MSSIPVTVIGGYLGAGKTTLVNQLLRQAGGQRLAVLVNDFGKLPIDEDLIENRDGDTLALAGGCVCCSFGSDLVDALRRLAARSPRPARLLVEASGVALPRAIAATVSLIADYANDGIVVLVDSRTVRRQAADSYLGDTITRQLREAGLILATKIDLIDLEARTQVRTWLEDYAPVLECERGQVALELLAGAMPPARGLSFAAGAPHPAYVAVSLEGLGACDLARLASSLRDPALGILRAKGILADGAGVVNALHLVAGEVEWAPTPAAHAGRLVCIGLRDQLDGPRIRLLAESCARA
ncbi:MAG: CobW family GTP-binding protein [Burkholderiales bacterium]